MFYRSTRQVVDDLRRHGKIIEVDEPISPDLEMAEIQRRVYARGGPAVLFSNPIGTDFPMVSNLFGNLEQARFLFRHTIHRVRRAIELKIDPMQGLRRPLRYLSAPWIGWTMLPRSVRIGAVLASTTTISKLPAMVGWPDDGGPFVTLPQVLSQTASVSSKPTSLMQTNLGMYRVQLAGNEYVRDQEVGLHYQIHRGIGVHHQAALTAGKPFHVSITVGGSPAMTLAAVMPLPEGMSELTFAGALAGHRIPMIVGADHAPIYADADFLIQGDVDPTRLKPEGPFGDHLGYYSKQHPFPFLRIKRVSHRTGAVWPFTVVGRPPQEDTTFGELIHELTGPIVPTVLPGVKAVHAVDAAGVHPLLLAVGSERYTPYHRPDRPQELLTQANAILGQGQMSLAKYLLIVNAHDDPKLNIQNIPAFFQHLLERIDWRRDLHFQTRTTIDTLDYSGDGFNQGSKLVMAASGPVRRKLSITLPENFSLPTDFSNPRCCLPGVFSIEGPKLQSISTPISQGDEPLRRLIEWLENHIGKLSSMLQGNKRIEHEIPLFVVVDDSGFASRTLNNFLWAIFTRSNPAADISGLFATIQSKHWGCEGALVIDARCKPHHAPPLIESPAVTAKIDALATRPGPLSKYL